MSNEKTLGVVIMVIGLVLSIIFLQKAKREEKYLGSRTLKQVKTKKQKKTILQYLIQKIKENQGIQETSQKTKQEKKSILQVIIEHLKEKPATDEEIKQLRLEAEKYRLKADIAKSKATISKSKGNNFGFGGSSPGGFGISGSSSQEDKTAGLLRDAVKTKDIDFFSNSTPDLFGNKDIDDKSDKEKESYRKRTLGF